MSWREKSAVLILIVVAVGALLTLSRFARPYSGPKAWDGTPSFSLPRAFEDVTTLATRFPRRWSGGPDRGKAADWLDDTLRGIGLVVYRDTFPAALGQPQPVMLENVWGVSAGTDRSEELVVVIGNYDMAPTSFQAASDTAAHVGTILELARLIHASPHHRTFIFLFPDGEEWGMLGARYFVQTFPARKKIVAGLSIEDLDVGNFQALGIDGVGQFRGFAPMWLRALAASAASRERFPVREAGPLDEWLQRSILVSYTDQGPFLGAGIPSIDLAGTGDDPILQNEVYHRPGDTIEKMRPQAVNAYGRIQERILRAIDALPEVPRESDYYLRLGPDRIVPGGAVAAVQALVFLPLLATVVFRLRRSQISRRILFREAVETGTSLFILLAALAVMRIVPRFGLMPEYELYPATARHPLLTEVHWAAVIVTVLGAAAAVWVFRTWTRMMWPRPRGHSRDAGVTATLIWLLVLSVVALLFNPFAAVTFLMLPTVLWIWVVPAATRPGRLLAGVVVGAGFLVVIRLFQQYGAYLQIGWYILWYVFMGITYGQFALAPIIFALATIAIGVRLLTVAALARA